MQRPSQPPADRFESRSGPRSEGEAVRSGKKGRKRRSGEGPMTDAPSAEGSARDRVCAFVAHQAERFPSFDPRTLDTTGLEARDAALAHAIADAVARRWITLSHMVALGCSRPFEALEPALQGVMLAGAAQLFLLDRVPAYAVIDHAVDWTKRNVNYGAGGFVNAVLRRAAQLRPEGAVGQAAPAGRAWETPVDALPLSSGLYLPLSGAVFPLDPWDGLAMSTGHPRQLIDTWRGAFGDERARTLAFHSLVHAPVILHTGGAGFLPLPPESLRKHAEPGYTVFKGDFETVSTLLDTREDVWVQDPASAETLRTVADLDPAPGTIIDLCAGQGTKTRQLAAVFPRAKIVATDTDPRRREVLARTFKGHARVSVVDPRKVMPDLAGWADLVLLDVPCSNTGVLARRPEAKYRFNLRAIEELATIQKQIIADGIPLLSERPEAALLYATCSLDQRENDAQGAWAREWHGFDRSRERLTLPTGLPGDEPTTYRDGGYSVLLRRSKKRR